MSDSIDRWDILESVLALFNSNERENISFRVKWHELGGAVVVVVDGAKEFHSNELISIRERKSALRQVIANNRARWLDVSTTARFPRGSIFIE